MQQHSEDQQTTATFAGTPGPWEGWQRDRQRAEDLVAQMSLDEKLSFVSITMASSEKAPAEALGSAGCTPGLERLGIPAWDETDASLGITNPNGIRGDDDYATAFPSSTALGATFSTELAEAQGRALGAEARAKGFTILLAGGMNLIREPRGGRIFEYVSEDVLLSGMIAGASVAGIQAEGVASTLKHFAVNPQETGRVMVSSDLTEKSLRESDLLAFQIAMEHGGPRSTMPGYNLVNGKYASENAFLLDEVLKGDWQFQGFTMADWASTHSTVHAARAGLDRQSAWDLDTDHFFGPPLKQAVQDGRVPESRLDEMVTRILTAVASVGGLEQRRLPGGFPREEHAAVARRVVEEGIVLAKNDDGALPLAESSQRIVVIGGHADQGVLSGGGSTTVTPPGWIHDGDLDVPQMTFPRAYHQPAPLDELRGHLPDREIVFLDGEPQDVAAQLREDDIALVFAEKWSTEARDSEDLRLDGAQDDRILAAAGVAAQTVVILETAGPVTMPWIDEVQAVVVAWYGGMGGAGAIARVLTGEVNPSGRLPVTFPVDEAQLPRAEMTDPATTTSTPGLERKGPYFSIDYEVEGADVGYRWFEREGHAALLPFGHGLSYTRFEYTDASVSVLDGCPVVELTVTNTGERAGIDTPQVYVAPPEDPSLSTTFRLSGWARVALEPGQSRRVRIAADERRIYASYDPDQPGWTVHAGEYAVRLARHAAARPVLEQSVRLEQVRLQP